MRIGHLQPTRPEWFDRNPLPVTLQGAASVTGGTGTVTLWSYTVPTGKKAYWDVANLDLFRTADGTPNIRALLQIRYTTSAVTATLMRLDSSVSNYGPCGDQWIGQAGIMVAGDVLEATYNITATDGTLALLATTKMTQFDA